MGLLSWSLSRLLAGEMCLTDQGLGFSGDKKGEFPLMFSGRAYHSLDRKHTGKHAKDALANFRDTLVLSRMVVVFPERMYA